MPGAYLAGLLLAIAGLVVIDWRCKLAFFDKPRRTAAILGLALVAFLTWDIICIHQGIFFDGHSGLLLGPHLATNLPIEEIGFLALLNYTSLLLWIGLGRRHV